MSLIAITLMQSFALRGMILKESIPIFEAAEVKEALPYVVAIVL